jgi:hypothetical protein
MTLNRITVKTVVPEVSSNSSKTSPAKLSASDFDTKATQLADIRIVKEPGDFWGATLRVCATVNGDCYRFVQPKNSRVGIVETSIRNPEKEEVVENFSTEKPDEEYRILREINQNLVPQWHNKDYTWQFNDAAFRHAIMNKASELTDRPRQTGGY